MAPHSRSPLPRRMSSRPLGIPRDRSKPIGLAFANGKVHRTAGCRRIPAVGTGWSPGLDAGGQSPRCRRVRTTGPGGDRQLPATSCPAFLGGGESRRARITRFLANRSPASHTVVRFAGGGHMKTQCDFSLCCTTARAPPFRRQRRHPSSWDTGRVLLTSSAPSDQSTVRCGRRVMFDK
jgi:hypothetical protein